MKLKIFINRGLVLGGVVLWCIFGLVWVGVFGLGLEKFWYKCVRLIVLGLFWCEGCFCVILLGLLIFGVGCLLKFGLLIVFFLKDFCCFGIRML